MIMFCWDTYVILLVGPIRYKYVAAKLFLSLNGCKMKNSVDKASALSVRENYNKE